MISKTMMNIENLGAMEDDVTLQVMTGYLDLLRNRDLVDVAENKVAVTRQQVERMERLVEVGNESRGKLLEVNAQLSSAKLGLTQAINAREMARLNLMHIMNQTDHSTFEIEKPLLPDPSMVVIPQLDSVYIYALDNLPQVKSAEFGIEAQEYNLAKQKGQRSPRLYARGLYYSNYSDGLISPEDPDPFNPTLDYPIKEQISNNRYQFKKIFGGLNWNPNLRSPMTEPGINVKVGDYILAVNGVDVTTDENIYSFFENTSGKIIDLTIGPNPDYSGSREVKVVPVNNESSLRNRDWVEGNLKKVHEATNGQVAYVYVPNTAGAGHQYFKRYFFPQANKKAIIVDERFNGGGSVADYYIDILLRPYQSYWNFRYGKDMKTPGASIQGPKVMIIDETAGSGGDMLPWMFRKFKVGTLVGKRTWGGLVGVLGFPEFIDGASVTAPNLAIWTKDGFIVENVGVPPDIEVEQWPAEVIKGNDPQLEKAIEVALEELKKNPPTKPVRPAYPIRVKK